MVAPLRATLTVQAAHQIAIENAKQLITYDCVSNLVLYLSIFSLLLYLSGFLWLVAARLAQPTLAMLMIRSNNYETRSDSGNEILC